MILRKAFSNSNNAFSICFADYLVCPQVGFSSDPSPVTPRVQDLEQYATSYSGLMRIERLQFIAEHCPQLRVEALKMALTFVQRTFNVDTYEEIHRKLTEATRYADNILI